MTSDKPRKAIRDKIINAFLNWEQQAQDADYYESQAAAAAEELMEQYGLDVDSPPQWLQEALDE